MKKKLLTSILAGVMAFGSGCATTKKNYYSSPKMDLLRSYGLYIDDNANSLSGPNYLSTIVFVSADQTEEDRSKKVNNCYQKAKSMVETQIAEMVAPAVQQALDKYGIKKWKAYSLWSEDGEVEEEMTMPMVSSKSIAMGFTKNGDCYYEGSVPIKELLYQIEDFSRIASDSQKKARKVKRYVKNWIKREKPNWKK